MRITTLSRRGPIVCFAAACFTGLLGTAVHGDYSSDPAAPTVLISTANDDVQPKVALGPGGSRYVSCFAGAGYDVRLTRVDGNGNFMWKTQSILVADRSMSSTQDYGLASDSAGNAYVTYNVTSGVELAAVSPAGTIEWKATVATSAASSFAGPHVCVASDGAVWVGYGQDSTSRVQRFDPVNGVASFAAPIIVTEASNTQIAADIQPGLSGAVILSCVRYTTFSGAKILRAHMFNADGTRPWATIGSSVFTTGSLQFGNFPSFIADGSGGAYFCWYTSSPLQCNVQRMNSSGTVLYGASGIGVTSTTTGFNRVSPSMTLASDNRLYVFWSQQVPSTSLYGVYGQCFAKGMRQWGNDGAAIAPMATVYSRTWATASLIGNEVACFYDDSPSAVQDNIRCAKVNGVGAVAWTSDVATGLGSRYRLAAIVASEDGAMLTWQGGLSTGASDIWAARIGADGVLGAPPSVVVGDLNNDGVVDAADLTILLNQWGTAGTADLNNDGVVDAADLAILLGNWSA